MIAKLNTTTLMIQAALVTGLLTGPAFAQTTRGGGANNFSSIARNITESIEELPGLVSALAYLMGILLGTLGIFKIKDHVENPTQTPLKDGAVRMAAGGALFGLPIVYESMQNTIGGTSFNVEPATLSRIEFQTQ